MTTSGSQTETYDTTASTTEATVTPRVMTQTEQIARYFTDDLTQFVHIANLDLAHELEIPAEEAGDTQEIIEMLFDDLSHMLREGLITGIHLLLSEPRVDANTGAYPLRYHALYTINQPAVAQRSLKAQRFGGSIEPPDRVWVGARFALLIDWNKSADRRRLQVRRPEYLFDWVPEQTRFDATSLVRYREGGLTSNGAEVVRRVEARSPGYKSRK
ncbi:MAG TPA: hypothetical protein VL485_33445 [Ktedonobacteraceae bacterium]|jgi:hypothetical protein|nr:hypothetical protein [Ktedonobacteraceae bacterium]